MSELVRDEFRETQVGTWFATALVIELLIAHGVVDRDEAIATLSHFERQTRRGRRTALGAIRRMLEHSPRLTREPEAVVPIRRVSPLCG
jgi:hypothetical protein